MATAHSFGRYRVTKTLGRGAMGEVYEATDDVLGREVAIKTLRSSSGVAARFIDERFRNEARAIAQFSHPGVVQVFDIDLSSDPPFLVMERVAGPSLDRVIDQGPLPPDQIAPLGIQIARALAAAHAAGVVHRDLKPSNILGAGPGTWKLADFGVAHVPDSSLTMTGQFVGSPAYAAPEALVKGVSTPAGDVYGLGATLYEAACGTWPRLEAKGALLAPVPPLREKAPNLPAHVAAVIDRAVSLDASLRPTASELADLLAYIDHRAVAPPPTAVRTPSVPTRADSVPPTVVGHHTPRALRWQPWAVVGAIVLVIIVVVATRDPKQPSTPGVTPPIGAGAPAPEELVPSQITVRPPPGLSGKQAKDWDKVVDALYEQNYSKALSRLTDWERRYGARDESKFLRSQLERLPPELFEERD